MADAYGIHRRAVTRLGDALAALPPDAPLRLAKQSSNLFRFGARDTAPGLPTMGLDRVIRIDPEARTAEVGGLITYDALVAATLPHGLMPKVVPQLKTITLGGAVAGLGIESASFRNGLPHESVREMDVLTGAGELVTVVPGGEHDALWRGLPNSYGTLGYALRLVIDLEPVKPFVTVRHLRFDDAASCFKTMDELTRTRVHEGHSVDFLDGVVFSPEEMYLSVGTFADEAPYASDYTGMGVYYKSLRTRTIDHLRVGDYLWRWDTDWFWCSAAFGVQNPAVRALWPKRLRRSDVYRRLVALDRRHGLTARLGAMRGQRAELVVQDVELPIERAAEFLADFCAEVPIRPIWLCPLALSDSAQWPLYPLAPGRMYVNFGFWATAPLAPGQSPDHHNLFVERLVDDLGGHKSLYSTVHYDRDAFWRHYNGEAYRGLKDRYDPRGRFPDLYRKVTGDHTTV
ncbi:FAD-linked oxidase [Actinorhabdospora filicis]|uniref:Delta(24)-sterol reductase n=1 Tax=Actinorhabdospora filicis TaxID=1785913 RepID=A0A9W6SIK1_9ACTN|nr:FAD-binding oxidoreductase [Actinorhabdospora filicis]GLZ76663.1 FAD-linked oxidase [Actinorhabdospora filicis]